MSGEWIAPGDLAGAAILTAVFTVLVVVAEAWKRLRDPDPEHTRKLVHLGGGVACLFFPFLVESPWVVLVLALGMTTLFVLGARYGFLQSLHGVARPSRGAEYYPLAIFLVFLLARERPWAYLAAVLVLAVGDAFAALVGGRYGRLRYEVEDEHKSLEGSLVFLVIAFLAIHLPVLLLTDLPREVTVLAALLVAVLVTGFEAISLQGADNLFVPLAVTVILIKITGKPLSEVVFQCVSLLAICLLVALVVWRFRSFNVGGTIAFTLFAYGAWSLGNWQWALPVLVGFGAFALAWFRFLDGDDGSRGEEAAPRFKVRTAARALLVPFLLLMAANGSRAFALLYGPYLVACGAVLALALPRSLRAGDRDRRWLLPATLGGLAAWAVVATPPWMVQRPLAATTVVASLVAVLGAALLGTAVDRWRPAEPRSRQWTSRRFLLPLAAAAVLLALQLAGVVPAWDPAWVPPVGLRRS